MDSSVLLKKGLEYTNKRRKGILVLGALGLTGYGAYKMYNMPSLVEKRRRLFKVLGSLVSVAEMVSDSAEAIGILSKDLKEFMASDSDQIPQSLKQISKITSSSEFSESLSGITGALTIGILRGYQHETNQKDGDSRISDGVLDKLFSEAGTGFASVVIGSFARNMVMAFYSDDSAKGDESSKSNKSIPSWVEVVCDDKCKELIGDCIQLFVSTAVSIYLDKTMNINTYDELFSGLTNPKNEAGVRDLLVSVCNGAVDTFLRTSNHVWTTNSKNDFEDSFGSDEKALGPPNLLSATLQGKKLAGKNQDSEWMNKISSTLAVPRNRKFVLDMTGMVTFETIRSFLEFMLQKLSECVKRSVDVAHQEVVDRGIEAIRYVGGRSSTVATICLTLCLHILNGPWILAPC